MVGKPDHNPFFSNADLLQTSVEISVHGLAPTEQMHVPGSKGDAHTTQLSVNTDVAAVGQSGSCCYVF